MRDYYEILMVHERAIPEVIDRVYRVLARKYHPDVQPPEKRSQAERRMTELNIAYNVLSDPDERSKYDSQRIVGAPRPVGSDEVETAGPGDRSLKCFNHPTRASVAFCWECGRPICEMCHSDPQAHATGGANWRVGHTICNTCVRRTADLEARMAAGRRADPSGPWHRRPMGHVGTMLYYVFLAVFLAALVTTVFYATQPTEPTMTQSVLYAAAVAALYVVLIGLRLVWRTDCPNCGERCGRVDFRRIAPWRDFFSPHPVCPECGRHFKRQEMAGPLD